MTPTAPEVRAGGIAAVVLAELDALGDLALLHDADGTATTAGALARRVCGAANELAGRVRAGDRVLLLGPTGSDWLVADLALLALGALVVPVYPTASALQLAQVVQGCAPSLALRAAPGGRDPEQVPVLAVPATEADLAPAVPVAGSDPATVVHTSGTTGAMRGCVLRHDDLLAASAVLGHVAPHLLGRGARALLALPLAHAYPRVLALSLLRSGTPTWLGAPPDLPRLLAAVRPTLLPTVPRALERLPADPRTLQAATGGQLAAVLTAGAPLPREVGQRLVSAGVDVLDAWGMTETTTMGAVTRPGTWRPGVVGQPSPGTALRTTADGELEVTGAGLLAGHWEGGRVVPPDLTPDGWLRTGDLAELLPDGALRLRGRSKDVLVTSGGKNVVPGPLEALLARPAAVAQALVVGDGRPYVTALVALDRAVLAANGTPVPETTVVVDLGRTEDDPVVLRAGSLAPDLLAELVEAARAAAATVSRAESVRRLAVLPDELSVERGDLTPTLKLRRSAVQARYADVVDALYG